MALLPKDRAKTGRNNKPTNPKSPTMRLQPVTVGPGTELKLLLRKFGLRDSGTCGCDAKAQLMNDEGPDWCERNIEVITDWLRQAANQRGLPFVRLAGRLLVKRAIRNARHKLRLLAEK